MRVTLQSAEIATPELTGKTDIGGADGLTGEKRAGGASFENVLTSALEEAGQTQRDAAVKSQALAQGSLDDIHGTMISVKEAELSLKLVGTVRNRLLDAFHEIWRTNV